MFIIILKMDINIYFLFMIKVFKIIKNIKAQSIYKHFEQELTIKQVHSLIFNKS